MKFFHQEPFAATLAPACVATIGNFDGLHLGHRAMLAQLQALALQYDLPSTVIVFEPQPTEFFLQDQAPGRLMRLRDKVTALRALGVNQVYCLSFDAALAALAPEDFVSQIFVARLGVKHLVVGEDFRFGHSRRGDLALLQRYAADFCVHTVAPCMRNGVRISSSAIRAALNQGRLVDAALDLGQPFRVTEKVIYGQQRGRLLNFPTINMALQRRVVPLTGVYAVTVTGVPGREVVYGVANLGHRPTVAGVGMSLETYLFDIDQSLYGLRLCVEFCRKWRDEMRFANLDALQQQISLDVAMTRQYFRLTSDNLDSPK